MACSSEPNLGTLYYVQPSNEYDWIGALKSLKSVIHFCNNVVLEIYTALHRFLLT